VAFSLACGSDGEPLPGDGEEPPPANATAIRQTDLNQVPEVQTLMRQVGGGQIDSREVIYADLTGDRREEAIAPLSSGGTLGNIAYAVLTLRSDTPTIILTRTASGGSGLVMQLNEDGRLIETAAQYGPEDPFCCPSQLRKTSFRWDGSRLQVEREEVIANPAGRPKQ
jgi:hypothetical protein